MFLKSLVIENRVKIIRNIEFHNGLNLIIDETPNNDEKATGNNIGKTTVLKLIDFCLGAKQSIIYSDSESKKEEYELVKKFLQEEEVLITLTLTEDLKDDNANKGFSFQSILDFLGDNYLFVGGGLVAILLIVLGIIIHRKRSVLE